MAVLFPFVGLVLNVSTVGVMWFGAQRVDSGQIEIGQLTAFLAYLMQILISVMMTTMLLVMAPRAAVCADRILEVLDTESSVKPPARAVTPERDSGVVVFDDISFSYPGAEEPVLRGVSFELRPGRTTGIIGSTGSGKTTVTLGLLRAFRSKRNQVAQLNFIDRNNRDL